MAAARRTGNRIERRPGRGPGRARDQLADSLGADQFIWLARDVLHALCRWTVLAALLAVLLLKFALGIQVDQQR